MATLMDLGDVAGNVKDGCHIAAMGGVWMIFVYGFAGLRDYGGELSFWPALPDVLHCIQFNLMFQGRTLEVDVGQATTSYRLKTGGGLTCYSARQVVREKFGIPGLQTKNKRLLRPLRKNSRAPKAGIRT